jgi:hypothetical protein
VGTGLPLNDFRFASPALSGTWPPADPDDEGPRGNRFRDSWLGNVIVPVPADYLVGIDLRWRDAERWSRESGENSVWKTDRGRFSPAILPAKVPLGTWGLILVAAAWLLSRPADRILPAAELVAWLSLTVLMALAESPAGFLFPMPVRMVLKWRTRRAEGPTQGITRSTSTISSPSGIRTSRSCVPSPWLAIPSASSYVTVEHADRLRKQSGLATDRDLAELKRWLAERLEVRPLGLACRAVTDPRALGIESTLPPIDPGPKLANAPRLFRRFVRQFLAGPGLRPERHRLPGGMPPAQGP